LRVFGDVVDAAPAEELNNELAWYAELLGQVRDREVLNTRLTKLIAELRRSRFAGRSKPRSPRLFRRSATTE
jgi:hypothetical protein